MGGVVESFADTVGDIVDSVASVALPASAAFFGGPALAGAMGMGAGLGSTLVGAGLGGLTSSAMGNGFGPGMLIGGLGGFMGGPMSPFGGMGGFMADPEALAWGTGLEGSADLSAMLAATGQNAAAFANNPFSYLGFGNFMPTGGMGGGGFGMPSLGGMAVGAGINFLINQYQQNRAEKFMRQMMEQGNPLNDPRRTPYQNMSRDLLENPQAYLQNNPFAVQLSQHFKNNVIPTQVAVTGNPNAVLDRSGSQFAQAIAGNYNELANILAGYGGFNQGNSGMNAGAMMANSALGASSEKFRLAGDVARRVFGDPTVPGQSPMVQTSSNQNPVTNAVRQLT